MSQSRELADQNTQTKKKKLYKRWQKKNKIIIFRWKSPEYKNMSATFSYLIKYRSDFIVLYVEKSHDVHTKID